MTDVSQSHSFGICGSFSTQRFNAPSNPFASELSEDSEEYREMHYYEKKKDWEKAAKAAEGVSEYAKNKFLQKARQEPTSKEK